MPNPALAIAMEIQRRNRKKMSQGGMVKNEAESEIQSVPMPNQQDFLSDEQDDSSMIANKEEFLSDDEDNQVGILDAIMNRMKMAKMRK